MFQRKIGALYREGVFPDLIISDIMMPEMRGDELCQKVKNDIDTSHIPVILLTALNTDKNIIDGLQTGADEYVVKPFNIGILRATIANLLANRALLRHRYGNLEAATMIPTIRNASTVLRIWTGNSLPASRRM